MKTKRWFDKTTQLRVHLTPHPGVAARREKIVLFGFAVALVLGTANLTDLHAQQTKPKAVSDQQNAKVLVRETSRSVNGQDDSALVKRIVLVPVRVGKRLGKSVASIFFPRESHQKSAEESSVRSKAVTTSTRPMALGNQKRVIYLHAAAAADAAAIEIVDMDVAGKRIEIGKMFEFNQDWLKQLRIRVRNISDKTISFVSFGGGLIEGVDEALNFSESYPSGVTSMFGKYSDKTSDERNEKGTALHPGETVDLGYSFLDRYNKGSREGEQRTYCQLVIGPQMIQFEDGTTELDAKIKYVSPTGLPAENISPPTPEMRCQYWQSKVDETLTAPVRVRIDEKDPGNILEGIGCLLQMEGNKHPSRFSGATQTYVSQLFKPATADVGGLYYVSYLFTENWEHADAIALQAEDGAINAPRDIEIAYQSYRRWYEQVKTVGIVKARQMNLRPLKDTDIDWY